MSRSDPVEIACRAVVETARAILIDDGDQEVWIPKSQILDSEYKYGALVSVTLPEWLAYERGLI